MERILGSRGHGFGVWRITNEKLFLNQIENLCYNNTVTTEIWSSKPISNCASSRRVTSHGNQIATISNLKSRSSILPSSNRKRYHSAWESLWIPSLISFLLVMLKAGGKCCKLLLQAPEKAKRKYSRKWQRVAAAWEPIVDAVMAILSKLDGLFTLKGTTKNGTEGF